MHNLRQDFRARFFDFFVPPIYERRNDILYYLYAKFPDLVKSLGPWEVLALLSYNWPDNVREIVRVGTLINRREIYLKNYHHWKARNEELGYSEDLSRLFGLGIPFASITFLFHKLVHESRVDIKSLESFLNQYRVGIDWTGSGPKLAFPDLEKHKISLEPGDEKYQERFGVKIGSFEPFEQAYLGYLIFSSLFFQDPRLDKNILHLEKCTALPAWNPELLLSDRLKSNFSPRFDKLKKPIFEFLSGIKLPKGVKIPSHEGRSSFNEFLQKYPSNPFFSPEEEGQVPQEDLKRNVMKIDLTMKYNDVLRYYHQKLIEYVGGNKKEAAELIGVNYQTFISRINHLGLK